VRKHGPEVSVNTKWLRLDRWHIAFVAQQSERDGHDLAERRWSVIAEGGLMKRRDATPTGPFESHVQRPYHPTLDRGATQHLEGTGNLLHFIDIISRPLFI
jgi:hypothetical protein